MKKILFLLSVFVLSPIALNAQSVDLLWQGEGYTPPFYKGRTLWSTQSVITLVAIPHVPGRSASSLFYRWEKDGTILGNYNAVGKNSLSFKGPALGNAQTVEIAVLDSGGAVLATNSVDIRPVSPSVLVYEDSPLYGVLFNREVGSNYEMREREVTLSAFPLFFSTDRQTSPAVEYEWRTGTGAVEPRPSVTYRTPEGARGTAKTTLRLTHVSDITQSASRNLSIIFDNDNGF